MKTGHLLATTLSLMAGLAFVPGISSAATATGTLQAKITITANCAVSASNAALDFGSNASTTATAPTGSTGFSVTCTNQTPYNVGLAPSAANNGGTVSTTGAGNMAFGTNLIGYQLYQDASDTTIWGNTVGTNTKTGTGSGAAQSYTVYGKTTSSLNVPAGSYADTVAINVTY